MQRRDFLIGAAAGTMGAAAPALAFEKVGDRRMMVFSGGQPASRCRCRCSTPTCATIGPRA
jgi:hypothetical protein